MNLHAPLVWLAAALCAALIVLAFVAAPHSCEWGLETYFWSGIAVVFVLFTAPFVLERRRVLWLRLLIALGTGGLGVAVWVLGLVIANVRILCRLF